MYENKTKKELIKIINDQVHLKDAVEAKDLEIVDQKQKFDNEKELMLSEIESLKKESKELKELYKGFNINKFNERITEALQGEAKAEQKYKILKGIYTNLLKAMQGTLDNAIELNYFIDLNENKKGE